MNRYYIEMHEDGRRLRCGDIKGYPTAREAQFAAQKHVDDALPDNPVYVVQLLGHARLTGDGEAEFVLD